MNQLAGSSVQDYWISLGLTSEQGGTFLKRRPVVYSLRTASVPGIGLIHWLDDERLRNGVIEVHDPGNGHKTLGRFRSRTFELAQALRVANVEIFGAAVINPRIEAMMQRLGFVPSVEPVPDDLGDDGTMEVYSRWYSIE